jgi:pimeloyl-ACP methyl ester carboxylesterase
VPVEEFGESIPLSLKTVDGVQLSGELTMPDEALDNHFTLLLAHEHGSNRQSWRPLMEDFMQMGFTVLSFDFRGHGESGGSADFSSLGIDVSTFTQYLLDSGYDRIICLGSSMGGTGCLEVALSVAMEGLVLVSAPMNIQGSGVTFAELEELRMPKLVMVAENDSATYNTPDFVTDILKMYELAPEPKDLFVSQSSIAHGLALLYGKPGEEARTLMFDFLEAMIGG